MKVYVYYCPLCDSILIRSYKVPKNRSYCSHSAEYATLVYLGVL